MGQIFLQTFGNGTAYVDDYYPVNNQRVHLVCTPYGDSHLDHITATDSYDHSIALLQTLDQTFVYQSAWNNMYIEVYFASGPTPPPTPTFPIWLLFKIRDGNNIWQRK